MAIEIGNFFHQIQFNDGCRVKPLMMLEFLTEKELFLKEPRIRDILHKKLERNAARIFARWEEMSGLGIDPVDVDLSDIDEELKSLFAKFVCQQTS